MGPKTDKSVSSNLNRLKMLSHQNNNKHFFIIVCRDRDRDRDKVQHASNCLNGNTWFSIEHPIILPVLASYGWNDIIQQYFFLFFFLSIIFKGGTGMNAS